MWNDLLAVENSLSSANGLDSGQAAVVAGFCCGGLRGRRSCRSGGRRPWLCWNALCCGGDGRVGWRCRGSEIHPEAREVTSVAVVGCELNKEPEYYEVIGHLKIHLYYEILLNFGTNFGAV